MKSWQAEPECVIISWQIPASFNCKLFDHDSILILNCAALAGGSGGTPKKRRVLAEEEGGRPKPPVWRLGQQCQERNSAKGHWLARGQRNDQRSLLERIISRGKARGGLWGDLPIQSMRIQIIRFLEQPSCFNEHLHHRTEGIQSLLQNLNQGNKLT